MKHSKWMALLLTGVCAVSWLAGCSGNQGKDNPPAASQQQSGAKMNEAVYEGSVLSGTVLDVTEGGVSVLAIQEETADDGGAVAIMPAPSSGEENNTTKVAYSADCVFQIVRIDASGEKAPEYQDAGAGDVKKMAEIIVFGEELSSGEVQADKVLIAQFYNKDKMPGSY